MDDFEAIKRQMEARRSSLAEKLEALECQVAEGVQGVTSAVSNVKEVVEDTVDSVKHSVESVKDSMQDTVGAVKDTLDFDRQMDAHPWVMVGGVLALGYLAGRLVPELPLGVPGFARSHGAPRTPHGNGSGHGNGNAAAYRTPVAPAPQVQAEPEPRREPSWFDGLLKSFGPEIDKLKGLALGAALGLVRDYVKRSAPPDLGSHLAGMIDNMTTKLGGQPLRDNLAAGCKGAQFSDSR